MKQLDTPEFASEAEEAKWWFENQDVIADAFLEERGLEEACLFIDKADAELARKNAAKQGLTYEAYVKQLLHDALQREAA